MRLKYTIHSIRNYKKFQFDESENSIAFIGCNFEQHENTKSSIFYDDKKSGNGIKIIGCEFRGKLNDK